MFLIVCMNLLQTNYVKAKLYDENGACLLILGDLGQQNDDICFFIMNLDPKYDNYLLDLISLLQEALIRTLSKKAIDLHKFHHYFDNIYDHLIQLETNFHTQTKKISKHVSKLKNFLSSPEAGLKQGDRKKSPNPADLPIQQPTVNFRTTYKSSYGSRQLKSIEQEEEEHELHPNPSKRRSETANGYRQKLHENSRPMTGQNGRNRYRNKTIEMPNNPLTQEQERSTIAVPFGPGTQRDRRMEFYDELEKIRDVQGKGLSAVPYNLAFRKRSRSQQKWTHKISRLL